MRGKRKYVVGVREPEVPEIARTVRELDPVVAQQIDETLATLTLKRRRFLRHYLETGNGAASARRAGYACKDPRGAATIASEIMHVPAVRHAYEAIMEARGLTARGLDEIAAIHLSRHSSVDAGDRDRSLRMWGLVQKYTVPRPGALVAGGLADEILGQMTADEQAAYAERRVWPERLRHLVAPATVAGGAGDVVWRQGRREGAGVRVTAEEAVHRHRGRERRGEGEDGSREVVESGAASGGEREYRGVVEREREYDGRREGGEGEVGRRRALEGEVVPAAWRDLALRDRRW